MRIRRSTGRGASPLPGHNENCDEQTRTCLRRIRGFAAGQSVCERSAGALLLVVVVSITVVPFGGDR